MPLSTMTYNITVRIVKKIQLNVTVLSIMLSVFVLSVFIMSNVKHRVIMLSVVMMFVGVPLETICKKY